MENEYSILLQQILRHTDNDINTYKTSLLNLMTRLNRMSGSASLWSNASVTVTYSAEAGPGRLLT